MTQQSVPLPAVFLTTPLAHRALHDKSQGRPENSRAAIRAAVEAGYGIEIDLQPSSDGVPMVFHDYDLGRLTASKGPIALQTAETLAATKLLFSDEGIPTLTEVLELVGGKVPLLIEFKDQDGAMGPHVGALEAAAAVALNAYSGPLALMSFNPHSVAELVRVCPTIPCGLITSAYEYDDWVPLPEPVCDRLRGIPDYDTCGASFISHESFDLHRKRVAELKAKGAAVLCWTIRSPEEEAEARRVAQNVTFEGYLA